MHRYALCGDQWERIKDLLPGREGWVGVTAKDDRPFVEAALYRCRAGIPWRDLPERFGAWTKVRTRSRRRAKAGVREGIFRHLAGEADDTSPPACRWWPASGRAAGRPCAAAARHLPRQGVEQAQFSSQRRNQPWTVRRGGQPAGRARQGPPTRRCHAIAPTTRRTGVARPLRGGSARSSHAAISSTARAATSPFRRGSCRARCASVHDCPSPLAPTIERLVPSRARQMGTARRSRLKQALRGLKRLTHSGVSKI